MMMAKDSPPNRPQLNATTVERLRAAFTQYLHSGNAADLQPALRDVAGEAREKRMHAEQLLIHLKDIWFELPQIAGAPEGPEQNGLLQRVVALSIREYYVS